MTTLPATAMCDACPARRSTLPFDLADMIAVRLLPAQFARVVGGSKQSVSKWIRAGKVTLGPDGRMDPVSAIQEVLRNTAPAKLRARLFRQAMNGADALQVENRRLQHRCARLEDEVRTANAALAAAEARMHRERAAVGDQKVAAAIVERERGVALLTEFKRLIGERFDWLTQERANPTISFAYALGELELRAKESVRIQRNSP